MKLKIFLIFFFQIPLFSMKLEEINKKIEDNNWTINFNKDYLKTAKSEYSTNSCLKQIDSALSENYELYQQKHELEKAQLEKYLKEQERLKEEQKDLLDRNNLLEENVLLKVRLNNLQSAERQQNQLNFLLQGGGLAVGAGLVLLFVYCITSPIDQRLTKSMYRVKNC